MAGVLAVLIFALADDMGRSSLRGSDRQVEQTTQSSADQSASKTLSGEEWATPHGMTASLPADAWQTVPQASVWDNASADYPPSLTRPALLVVEGQENYRARYGEEMIGEVQLLIEEFRRRCLPIIFKVWPYMMSHPVLHTHPTKTCTPTIPMPELAPSTESEINRTVKYLAFDHFVKNPHLPGLLESWDVDHVVIAGGYTEHCIIATASAAFNHKLGVVMAASAIGPSKRYEKQDGKLLTSVQHEAALISMKASTSTILPTTAAILTHFKVNNITGSVCSNSRVDRPPADYMRHAFPKEQKAFCNSSFPAIDGDMVGAWPLWAPFEARNLSEALKYRNSIPIE
jgi:nicotinamidase-related amidase